MLLIVQNVSWSLNHNPFGGVLCQSAGTLDLLDIVSVKCHHIDRVEMVGTNKTHVSFKGWPWPLPSCFTFLYTHFTLTQISRRRLRGQWPSHTYILTLTNTIPIRPANNRNDQSQNILCKAPYRSLDMQKETCGTELIWNAHMEPHDVACSASITCDLNWWILEGTKKKKLRNKADDLAPPRSWCED